MKASVGSSMIAIDALRVGLYIHLDLGWMSHPFALSHFKITTTDQIATLRGLGLKEVRCSPELSDGPVGPAGAADALPAPAAAVPARVATAALDASGAPTSAALDTVQRQRAQAAAERVALETCNRQFGEAATALREIHDQVMDQPVKAGDGAVALSAALMVKMAGQQELCIRVLGEASGDKASAHALNVAVLSMLMARCLGWGDKEMGDLGVGALMHDVGKLELPERVRNRDDQFTPAESRYYEEHVARGVAQARRLGLSAGALLVIGQHHEMGDHSGFPLKIGSERMTAAARIVALVNRYDRLCNPARAHTALTPHEAVSRMFAQYQNKFDTTVLGAFVKMMGVYPPGSVVQLTDDRLAIVISVNSSRPLKPRVQLYQPGVPVDEQVPLNLEAMPGLGIRRSLKPQVLSQDALQALAPRHRVAYFFEPVQRAPSIAPLEMAA